MAAALGKVLAAVLSPVGSFGIHRPWPPYWRLCSPWKSSQEAHRVGLGIRLSLSSSMDSGVTLSPKGRFPVSALLDPSPARCRERGGVETNQAEKWERQTARAGPHQQTQPASQVSQTSGGVTGTDGHKEPWLLSLLGPKTQRPLR